MFSDRSKQLVGILFFHFDGFENGCVFVEAEEVRLVHDPLALLAGRLKVREIVAIRPQINLEELVARADKALYSAKARGRNRVEHG